MGDPLLRRLLRRVRFPAASPAAGAMTVRPAASESVVAPAPGRVTVTFTPGSVAVELPGGIGDLAAAHASRMMDAGELLHLAAALAAAPRTPGALVVEIGAFEGRTTVFMARVLERLAVGAPVLSIDPFERAPADRLNPRGRYAAYRKTIRRAGLEQRCLPLAAFSDAAACVVPDRIALLVIDGSHHYAAVRKDFALYAPKVLPGGFLFVDDYGASYPDVVRATDEFLAAEPAYTRVHQSHFVIARRSSGGCRNTPPKPPFGAGGKAAGESGLPDG